MEEYLFFTFCKSLAALVLHKELRFLQNYHVVTKSVDVLNVVSDTEPVNIVYNRNTLDETLCSVFKLIFRLYVLNKKNLKYDLTGI